MKKIIILIGFIVLVSFHEGWCQTRRIILLEEATNASCGSCADHNDKLQTFVSKHFGGVVSVRYHAWWPGFDPMYTLNQDDNTDRISYYDIAGVPNYLLDGTNYGVPSNPDAMVMNMYQRLSQPAPVNIIVATDITVDSVKIAVSLIGLTPVIQSQLFLRTAIIERMVTYTSAPGTNGETIFPDVMRKMLPDAAGVAVSSIEPDDTLRYHFSYPVQPEWNYGDLAVVSWLQSDETRDIIQSGINLPTYCIASLDSPTDVLDVNQHLRKDYWLCNENPHPLHLRITLDKIHVPEGWTYSLTVGQHSSDSLDVTVTPSDSLKFTLMIQTGSEKDWIKLYLTAKNLEDPHGYGFSRSYFGIIPQGEVLFVDDDGSEEYESHFFSAFQSAGEAFTYIEEPDLLTLTDQFDLDQFQSLFWNVSWGFPSLVPEDIELLTDYLDNGGNLFLSGQDIGWDIFDRSGHSYFPEAQDFYQDYLDASYIGDNAGRNHVIGVPGDPISDGLSFDLLSVYALYPEWIGSYSGTSVPILTYTGTSRSAALRYDSDGYKTVYLGLGLEQISDPQAAQQIIERTLAWFKEGTSIEPVSELIPNQYQLFQNYPNPFNADTDIRYQIPDDRSPVHTTLNVYNILGQEVRTLVDEIQEPGHYIVPWNGKDRSGSEVSSGIYFYRIQAGDFTAIKRMVLIK